MKVIKEEELLKIILNNSSSYYQSESFVIIHIDELRHIPASVIGEALVKAKRIFRKKRKKNHDRSYFKCIIKRR